MNLEEIEKTMKIGIAALTDTQRLVLASGKALAEELGLTRFTDIQPMTEVTFSPSEKEMAEKLGLTQSSYILRETEFTEGQTVLIATPFGTKVGIIVVEEIYERAKTRHTEYFLNDELLFQKTQRLRGDEWVTLFGPELNIPANSVLYVS